MLGRIKLFIGKFVRLAYRLTYRLIPCEKNMVLFISFHGRGYSDNPKAIYEYLRKQNSDLKYIWAIKNHKQKNIQIEGAKVIEYFSIPYFYYLARSKYWVVNCKLPTYILKKENQVYLQTWHGTPLKRLAHDIVLDNKDTTFYRSKMSAEEMYNTYDEDVRKYNYMISPNPYSTKVFKSAFRINEERLIETGYPRNDILVNSTNDQIVRIKERLGLPKDKKVLLYAPTWRDNSYVIEGYTFKLQVDFRKWQEALGEEYIVVFKPHYLIINDFDIKAFEGFVYEASATSDIAELYLISDLLITDYSSVFFDYAILNRPMYFYMFDLDEYASELRGFYFDIYETLPGPIVQNENDLLAQIKNSNFDYDRLKKFNQEFNEFHDGQCAKKVCDILFER